MAEQGPVRVTHLVFDLDGGGLETLVGALARHWAGSSVTMSIVTLSGRTGRVGALVTGAVDQFHAIRPVRGLSMAFPVGIARTLRRTRPDIVHLHSGAWFKGAWAAWLAGVRHVVYTEHGREHLDTPGALWRDRQSVRLTDIVITVSDRLAGYVQRELAVAPHRLRTIVNGVDTARFTPGASPAALRATLGIPPHAVVVGSVGRLETVKAYDRLIAAFARVRAGDGDRPAYLVICGDGSQRAALKSCVAEAGLGEWVRLPGWIDNAPAWYRLFDVFALSSDSEGLSVSLLEAMASGCAPVVTDVGASAFVVGPALRAQVVPPGSVAALADALAGTLGDAERRQALGSVARERVESQFSLDRMVREYEGLYRELVSGSRARP